MKIMLKVMERDPETGEPVYKGDKLIYAAKDFGQPCNKWVRETAYRHEFVDLPVQTSGFRFAEKGIAKNEKDSLVYMHNNSNSVQHNGTMVGLYSNAFGSAHGLHLYPDNFMRAMALFAARKSIKQTWINNCDEYVAPSPQAESSGAYQEFAADALIYALFHPSNNCTSVRGIPHKGRKIDVGNQMFWYAPDDMRELADSYNCQSVYRDLRGVDEAPYVEGLIQSIMAKASPEAQEVFHTASSLMIESLENRDLFNQANPEYQLSCWDAGYYQLKYLWKEMYPEEFKELREQFKALEETIIPRVYSLGFLRSSL